MKNSIKLMIKNKITDGLARDVNENLWMIDESGDRTGNGYKLNGEFKVLYKHICDELGHHAFIDYNNFIHSPHSRKETVVYALLDAIKEYSGYQYWLSMNKGGKGGER